MVVRGPNSIMGRFECLRRLGREDTLKGGTGPDKAYNGK